MTPIGSRPWLVRMLGSRRPHPSKILLEGMLSFRSAGTPNVLGSDTAVAVGLMEEPERGP